MTYTLITGASGGIGEAFARRLASDGHDLVLVARSAEKLEALCSELQSSYSIDARYIELDLSTPDADKELFEKTEQLDLNISFLINNAGFGSQGDFAVLPIEKELEMIRLNISALVGLSHLYLEKMRERRSGTIVNISSAAGFQPVPFMATYAATKAFVTAFTEAISEENRPFGIRILAVCPGSTETNFFKASGIDRATTFKGQQTAEDVVETTLKALKGGRAKVISGWANYAVASAVNFMPNALISKIVSRGLRSRYQK